MQIQGPSRWLSRSKALAVKVHYLSLLLGTYMTGETDIYKLSHDLHRHAMTYPPHTHTKKKQSIITMQVPGPIPKTVNQNWSGPQARVHKHRLF